MKKFLRVICFTLTVLIVVGLSITVFPASAATADGLKFSNRGLYSSQKTYEEAPNTFEAWIKLPTSAKSRNSGMILSNHGSGNRIVTFEIYTNGNPRLRLIASETQSVDWIFNDVNVCTGTWVHLAIVRDLTNSVVNCYINGVLAQSLPITDEAGRTDVFPAGGLCIGGDTRADNPNCFIGQIREISVFSSAHSKDEICADMTSVSKQDGLIAHYDLSDHQSGTDIHDLSGNGYEIKYKSNATWISPSDKEPVTDYAYSFAVVGDTQKVNIKHPENFDVIYDWILDNVESKKMKFVFGLGDITDESSPDEWARAKESIHSMDGKVDYSIVRGNHDTVIGFNSTFPWSDYKDTFEGGKLGATMLNTWRTLTLGDHKYLLITLDFGPSDAILDWASELCEEYPDHKVIITTHAYLYSNGTPIDADDHCAMKDNGGYNNGDDMWDKLISKHENILLVISGHEACDRIVVAQNEGENGNVVTQMLVNPQLLDLNATGGLGLVAMLYFSEDGRNVTVEYYSTIKNKFYRDINQFSFSLYPNDEAPETSTQETTAEVTTTETSTAEVTTEVITLSEVTTAEVTTEVVTSDEVTSEEEIVSSEVVDSDNTEKSGCGSSISLQASAIIIVILGAALTITRKKYD